MKFVSYVRGYLAPNSNDALHHVDVSKLGLSGRNTSRDGFFGVQSKFRVIPVSEYAWLDVWTHFLYDVMKKKSVKCV